MAKGKTEKKPTEYVVLREVEAGDAMGWVRVGLYTATTKSGAIRQHTGDGEDVVEGVWKAVPLSNWRGGESTRRTVTAARDPIVD